ncbi:glutathione-disulfide reductase [Pacificimonas flava]|uniref:Glutathione-disulfide reductase n=2 Tax=Pacificimonas TaxID=1960290 RepID=A0A219B732_9SPHN|nr:MULTISPECIES: glutathione-disulfide reductase [Pacificimonas]MBZ6378785.1 glutathione-disulfide reductase [Pacificimonas aurantium]OWV33953.1 glutathione-disulfide reductase [Pacificimonas flava]
MSDYDYDYFVIGGGSGGVRTARIAAGHGAKVGLAEEYRVGGTCVIRGCVPKKLLIYGAHFAEDLVDAERFGWTVNDKSFDWQTLRKNVLEEVDRIEGAYTSTLESHKVDVFHDRAVFQDAHTLKVGDRTITADKICIATGARPGRFPCEGQEHAITSNEVFHLEKLPDSILIAGGGYIANEFAGIFNELGSKVTVVNRSDKLLRAYDHSVVERMMHIATIKGIEFVYNAPFAKVEKREDGGVRVTTEGGETLEADLLLAAIGRPPNTDGLNLEDVGVDLTDKGAIRVDDASRTSVDNIFAVGDVTDRVQLTPVAIREGHALADTLFGGNPWTVDYDCIPSAVFSHPPIAQVGMTEAEARDTLGGVEIYTSDFRAMKNVLANRNERSLYKLVVDSATRKLVGAHMIGPDAPEIMQALAIAVKAGLTKEQVDATVAIHPTMAEELVLMR